MTKPQTRISLGHRFAADLLAIFDRELQQPRRVLLGPENYRSEDLPWDLRLTEGSFLERIQGKYVLIYSVGLCGDRSYKTGAAFSDTLIPPEDAWYKKVLITDPNNVWGNSAIGGKEREK